MIIKTLKKKKREGKEKHVSRIVEKKLGLDPSEKIYRRLVFRRRLLGGIGADDFFRFVQPH